MSHVEISQINKNRVILIIDSTKTKKIVKNEIFVKIYINVYVSETHSFLDCFHKRKILKIYIHTQL